MVALVMHRRMDSSYANGVLRNRKKKMESRSRNDNVLIQMVATAINNLVHLVDFTFVIYGLMPVLYFNSLS